MQGPPPPDIVRFRDGSTARYVEEREDDARTIVERLGVQTRSPVIVVCGGAGGLRGRAQRHARAVLGAAVARAAETASAVVVDGGTNAGVMTMVGEAREHAVDSMLALVGVAPRGRVFGCGALDQSRLESRHTHFVFARGDEWGEETPLLFRIADAIADGSPKVVVLAGGGTIARTEMVHAARRRWPVVILGDTRGLAGVLARASRRRRLPKDAELREIVRDSDLQVFRGTDPRGLARVLMWELISAPVLKAAWRRFAGYNRLATALRRSFIRSQRAIVGIGIVGTVAGITYEASSEAMAKWLAIGAPAALGVAIGYVTHRAAGKRWVLLRGAAEAVKVEIYRYRTRTGLYAGDDRDGALAEELDRVTEPLGDTDASNGRMDPEGGRPPPDLNGLDDDGISDLNAERYVRHRVADQIRYYRKRVREMERTRTRLVLTGLIFGFGGALVAAAGAAAWVAVTSAVAAAATSFLSILQLDRLVVVYNQSATRLESLHLAWLANPHSAEDRSAFETLVVNVETALTSELSGWVEQMNGVVRDLHARLEAQQSDT